MMKRQPQCAEDGKCQHDDADQGDRHVIGDVPVTEIAGALGDIGVHDDHVEDRAKTQRDQHPIVDGYSILGA